ncbi:DNA/RNA nuclease SfsA [Prochlorococcus sp. MIT 1300]|uniref:DNA/RNA nuclease SfsA n=1 Tax=Prochlorococcus sp. MIT 1300 TaxID=3096218 RepID=UPI002A74C396|nr:DNA/RNA nuclease SfsA [Prochlorococcus sp. MIT 1300]
MESKTVLKFPALKEGTLLRRYKRFLADIEFDDGEKVTAHCANTGPMTGVLLPGGRVRLRHVNNPARKLAWTWEQAKVPSLDGGFSWVGINTALPNTLVRLAIEAGFLDDSLGQIETIRREVPYGLNRRSRIDLLLTPARDSKDSKKIYVEVKNTTWADGSLALFPDSVTQRGQKHLEELMGVVLGSSRGVLIPCLSRIDVKEFAPGDSADPVYGRLFRKALKTGVEVVPCCFGFHREKITWEGVKPLKEGI